MRELPLPIDDAGGWRVETGSPDETRRYVFARATDGLIHLGETVDEPRVFLKLCADPATLAAILPPRWTILPPGFVITGPPHRSPPARLPAGYRVEQDRRGDTVSIAITTDAGQLAASGHAAELDGIFIYDRIVTAAPPSPRPGNGADGPTRATPPFSGRARGLGSDESGPPSLRRHGVDHALRLLHRGR